MKEIKVDRKVHDLLQAVHLSIINSINEDGYAGKYFLYKKSDSDESGFVKIWNYTYANNYTAAQQASAYLAFHILDICYLGCELSLDQYMKQDWYNDFHQSAMKLIDPEDERKIRCFSQRDVQEAVVELERLIKEYFKNYEEIMKQEKLDRKSYDDFYIKQQEGMKDRVEKLSADIPAAIKSFNQSNR